MKYLLLSGWLLLIFQGLPAEGNAAPFDWQAYDKLLKQHVHPGVKHGIKVHLVDYSSLTSAPQMEAISQKLANYDPRNLTPKQTLAFYINAYNFFALKLVRDHYPVDSIRDLGNFFFPVWKKDVAKIHGQSISLHEIEHNILRTLNEPRIHFAIVCASLSCPDLRQEAYTAEQLDQQLNDQTQRFLSLKKGLQLHDDTLYLSKIFQWFEEDFIPQGGVLNFVRRYRPDVQKHSDFESLSYDWRLNDQTDTGQP